jgi:release factor glutamine methyltransferase
MQFEQIYSPREASALAKRLLQHLIQVDPAWIVADTEIVRSPLDWENLHAAVERVASGEPLQYVLGETEFYGLTFHVNRHVLIPRPETEYLVQLVREHYRHPPGRILDLGTGTGCIAITSKHLWPTAEVVALDLSVEALKVAKANARRHQVDVEFIQADMLRLSSDQWTGFDLIISNPPYVRNDEKKDMHINVLSYEPELALFVPDHDPLIFYRSIAKYIPELLPVGGTAFLEINQGLSQETFELFNEVDSVNTHILKDLSGKKRFLKILFAGS